MELVYQGLARGAVMSHLKAEKESGREIHPAFEGLRNSGAEDDEVTKGKLISFYNWDEC